MHSHLFHVFGGQSAAPQGRYYARRPFGLAKYQRHFSSSIEAFFKRKRCDIILYMRIENGVCRLEAAEVGSVPIALEFSVGELRYMVLHAFHHLYNYRKVVGAAVRRGETLFGSVREYVDGVQLRRNLGRLLYESYKPHGSDDEADLYVRRSAAELDLDDEIACLVWQLPAEDKLA